jgi:hypothetical protein
MLFAHTWFVPASVHSAHLFVCVSLSRQDFLRSIVSALGAGGTGVRPTRRADRRHGDSDRVPYGPYPEDGFGSALTEEEAVAAGVAGPGHGTDRGDTAGLGVVGVAATGVFPASGGGIATAGVGSAAAATQAGVPVAADASNPDGQSASGALTSSGGTPWGVPSIPTSIMRVVQELGSGSFGIVDLVDIRGVLFAVKRTSTGSADKEATARELDIYNRVHRQPHPHITPLYGVCTDHTDGLLRLVMRRALCSLEELLKEAKGQVRPSLGQPGSNNGPNVHSSGGLSICVPPQSPPALSHIPPSHPPFPHARVA